MINKNEYQLSLFSKETMNEIKKIPKNYQLYLFSEETMSELINKNYPKAKNNFYSKTKNQSSLFNKSVSQLELKFLDN